MVDGGGATASQSVLLSVANQQKQVFTAGRKKGGLVVGRCGHVLGRYDVISCNGLLG